MAGQHDWDAVPQRSPRAAGFADPAESDPGSDTTRVQLVLPTERVRMLDQLAAEAGVATRKDLFNNALALLNWAVREVRRGRVIASVDESAQRFTELQMPMLDAVAANTAAKSPAR